MPHDCGKKRVIRCYKKIEKFLQNLQKLDSDANLLVDKNIDPVGVNEKYREGNNLIQNTKFLIPIYLNHTEQFPIENINEIFFKYKHLIKGFLLFMEDHHNLSSEKIKYYKRILNRMKENYEDIQILVSSSNGHPSK